MAERTKPLGDEERRRLESERDFLLESIEDLDREHDAGDLDDADYASLRDDYTVRAARVLRSLDADAVEIREVSTGRRRWLWIAAVGLFAVLAGVLVARSAGSRTEGEVASGDIRRSSRQLLLDAADLSAQGDLEGAIELYDEALDIVPGDAEALTYRGWLRFQIGEEEAGAADLAEAVVADPDLADARVFRSVVAFRTGDLDTAVDSLRAFDALDPPPSMLQLVDRQRLRQNVTSALVAEGRIEDAIALYDSALATRPDDALLVAERGWLLALVADQAQRTGDEESAEALTTQAIERLDRAVELDPALPDAYAYRAVVRLELLDDSEGAADDVAAYEATAATRPDLDDILAQSGL